MKELAAVILICIAACAVTMIFSLQKEAEIQSLVRSGITPAYHDFLVQCGLMGASIVFGFMGVLIVVAAIYAKLVQ
jgi:hypothetical protein